jgi:hypothetical protein
MTRAKTIIEKKYIFNFSGQQLNSNTPMNNYMNRFVLELKCVKGAKRFISQYGKL